MIFWKDEADKFSATFCSHKFTTFSPKYTVPKHGLLNVFKGFKSGLK